MNTEKDFDNIPDYATVLTFGYNFKTGKSTGWKMRIGRQITFKKKVSRVLKNTWLMITGHYLWK